MDLTSQKEGLGDAHTKKILQNNEVLESLWGTGTSTMYKWL